MALQKALEGYGQRWPRRAITSFQNLPKNQKRTRWNALLVFPCCRSGARRLRGGLCLSWHPGLPQRRIDPSVWISRGLSMFLLPIPSGGRAVLTRATDDLFYPAAARGALRLPSRAAA